ncbi:MAG: hypothetical protein BMS9Abin20_0469 [Acidimicrobiia bacterium]|nr:MAG: hypothetical protein BMS9Abin20_0469 [Acidimicrobiia bacterium]
MSEETPGQIDRDTEDLINGQHPEAIRILTGHRDQVVALAPALSERETATDDDPAEIFGSRLGEPEYQPAAEA